LDGKSDFFGVRLKLKYNAEYDVSKFKRSLSDEEIAEKKLKAKSENFRKTH
jgi:hypothetical protein